MKKYADRTENSVYQKHETLEDVLKTSLLKSLVFEKALESLQSKK